MGITLDCNAGLFPLQNFGDGNALFLVLFCLQRLFHAVVDGQQDKVTNLLRHIDADMNMKVVSY